MWVTIVVRYTQMDDYESIPLYWINRLGFVVRKELARRFQDNGFDISPEEWAILLILWNKGDQTPSVLADATIRDRTTVTRLLDGMVTKGLIKRETDPTDRRKMRVQVSDLGLSLKDGLVAVARDLIAQTLDGITPEDAAQTVQTLRRMSLNLLPESEPKGAKS
ncbi:MAG: MarR family transcriptional regulator [Rhodobacteraceae bacterium]|nr:MarR family transcriptional regulator [Paracoccaceae bacterium]